MSVEEETLSTVYRQGELTHGNKKGVEMIHAFCLLYSKRA